MSCFVLNCLRIVCCPVPEEIEEVNYKLCTAFGMKIAGDLVEPNLSDPFGVCKLQFILVDHDDRP